MEQTLNFKSAVEELASIKIMNKHTNKPLTPILRVDTLRFSGDQNGEVCFEFVNHTEFDLTIDIPNTNKDKIHKIDLLKPFETIIERNEVLGCAMVLEEYITDKGSPSCLQTKDVGASENLKLGMIVCLGQLTHAKYVII